MRFERGIFNPKFPKKPQNTLRSHTEYDIFRVGGTRIMYVEQHGNKYRATIQVKRKRYRATFDHYPTENEMMLAVSRQLLDEGRTSVIIPFKDCVEKYIDDRSNTASPSTIRGYKAIKKVLPARLMEANVTDIDQSLVQSVINELSATRKPKTIRNIHGLISAVLGIYKPDLVLRTSLPAKVKADYYIPTDEEVKKLREYVKDSNYEIPFLLACNAMRRSEICALTLSDIDSEKNIIHINKAKVMNDEGKYVIKNVTKTTEGKRDLEVSEEVIKLILERGKVYDGCPNNLSEWIIQAERRLGIPEFSFHKLRHYYASTAHALGVPDLYIQKQGGWASTEVLKTIYQHTLEETAQKESKKVREHLNKVLFTDEENDTVEEKGEVI